LGSTSPGSETTGITLNTARQIRAREKLICDNLARIRANLDRARHLGDEDPVALVLDPRDDHARAILALANRPRLVAEAARRGPGSALIWAMPKRVVVAVLAEHFDALADAVAQLATPNGEVIVAVAAGGTVAFVMEPRNGPAGQAVVRVLLP
jgi:hypothetical protein